MSALTVYPDNQPQLGETFTEFSAIQNRLNGIGVQFERWTANGEFSADADQDAVLAAYSDSIDRLKQQYSFQSVDVISLNPDHPDKAAFRQKFLAEHIHADFEVRFFIEGRGLFYLHVDDKVYAVLCEQGDLISVPANTTHWFDMGENPCFKCIRLFTTADGWVADFSGSDIAKSFPTLDQYVAGLS
ncbi:MAG: cupin [Methylobacter sp.]|uniref:Acireductone dioxygenase n=1 Tax=Candidatus Methylobacter titanis TaxID=3053457 RepID=A0AA43Q373_9GAMM|nr:cupin [Candidatus Methylobacter titanis]